MLASLLNLSESRIIPLGVSDLVLERSDCREKTLSVCVQHISGTGVGDRLKRRKQVGCFASWLWVQCNQQLHVPAVMISAVKECPELTLLSLHCFSQIFCPEKTS